MRKALGLLIAFALVFDFATWAGLGNNRARKWTTRMRRRERVDSAVKETT